MLIVIMRELHIPLNSPCFPFIFFGFIISYFSFP